MSNDIIVKLETFKAETKVELESLAHLSVEDRIKHLTQQASGLIHADEVELRVKGLVYLLRSLILDAQFGVMKTRERDQVCETAEQVLTVLRATRKQSPLRQLWSDFEYLRSQFLRNEGSHWEAAWKGELANQLSETKVAGFQSLVSANRAMRIGQGAIAEHHYQKAIQAELVGGNYAQARVGLLKLYRLSGRLEEAASLLESLSREKNDIMAHELEWEKYVLQAIADGNFRPIMNLVSKKKGSHHLATYIIDAYLWTKSHPRTEFDNAMNKLSTFARSRDLKLHELKLEYKSCGVLENCYDDDFNIHRATAELGSAIFQASQFQSIEKELLFIAASVRWLYRMKYWSLATLAYSRYETLSLGLSQGKCKDALGIAGDIADRSWYMEVTKSAS